MTLTIERFFDRYKLDTPPVATNIYLDGSPAGIVPR